MHIFIILDNKKVKIGSGQTFYWNQEITLTLILQLTR